MLVCVFGACVGADEGACGVVVEGRAVEGEKGGKE